MPTADRSYLWPGVPLALASAVLFGASTPFSKLLLNEAAPQLLAGLLYLAAGVGLAFFHFWLSLVGLPAAEAPLRRSDAPWLAAVVFFGGVIGPLLLMLGLARTDAASAALLLNLEGLATMAIAWLAFRENVDARLLAGAIAILSGAAVLSWRGGGIYLDSGALLIATACLAWGIDNNLTRKLSSADPVLIAATKGVVAGTANILLAYLQGAAIPSSETVGAAAIVGFLGIGVSLVFFVLALRYLGTARTGAYFSSAPFIGALLSIILLHDRLSDRLAVSAALMGLGLWMHLTERHEHEHEHDALEHEHSHFHDVHHQHEHEGPVTERHSHWHRHEPMRHSHPHYPDLHHRHIHGRGFATLSIQLLAGALTLRNIRAEVRRAASPFRSIAASPKRLAQAAFAALLTLSLGAVLIVFAPNDWAPVKTTPMPFEPRVPAPGEEPARPPAVAPVAPKAVEPKTAGQAARRENRRGALKSTAPSLLNKKLPNGVELDIPARTAESRLLAFLERGTRREGQIAWFVLARVSFGVAGATPTPYSEAQLQNIAAILLAYPAANVIIGGCGDAYRASGAVRKITKARAESVRRELMRLGVDSSRLTVDTKGPGSIRDRISIGVVR